MLFVHVSSVLQKNRFYRSRVYFALTLFTEMQVKDAAFLMSQEYVKYRDEFRGGILAKKLLPILYGYDGKKLPSKVYSSSLAFELTRMLCYC
ncbi:hypothetical protein SAMN05428952_10394 [Nitrosomonas sp. Nm132]|nr:hypothetical protein SAMN05428952_10394 [Nitrosomonas sp. Nm132]